MSSSPPQRCLLPWTACVDASGTDAVAFLRGQLTQDPPAEADSFAFAAWNDARGRVRALFRVLHLPNRCVLIAERENIESVLSKLRMFVLRAKVELTLDDTLQVMAVIGDSTDWLSSRGIALAAHHGAAADSAGVTWLRVGGRVVYVVGAEVDITDATGDLPSVAPALADIEEIEIGIPRIGSALEERYVPQMLNLDRLDAISFTKGCYPGQEVVARLHNLGTVKRRMQRFSSASGSAPSPGAEIIDGEQNAVGEVIRAAAADGRTELLAVVRLDVLDAPLFVGPGREMALTLQPLPY